MSAGVSEIKELTQPEAEFGVKFGPVSTKDFVVPILCMALAILMLVASVIAFIFFTDFWYTYGGFALAIPLLFIGSIMSRSMIYDEIRQVWLWDVQIAYSVWIEKELKPFLESKHGVKLDGDFFTNSLMAEKDGNVFEVKLFGIKHVPSYIDTDGTARSWSHPKIIGEVCIKKVDSPDAVVYSKM